MNIALVYALPGKQQVIVMAVETGTRARDAVVHAVRNKLITLSDADAELHPGKIPIGVYGQVVTDDYLLQEGDRLELYRPLLQDPKERRRQMADQKSSMRDSPSRSQK